MHQTRSRSRWTSQNVYKTNKHHKTNNVPPQQFNLLEFIKTFIKTNTVPNSQKNKTKNYETRRNESFVLIQGVGGMGGALLNKTPFQRDPLFFVPSPPSLAGILQERGGWH